MCNVSDTDILHGVCSDVRFIVYRYIFDYNYVKLRKQYVYKWLCDNPFRKCRIYWSDEMMNFMYNTRNLSTLNIANYRTIDDPHPDDDIYNMYDYSNNEGIQIAKLSPNHRYSKPK